MKEITLKIPRMLLGTTTVVRKQVKLFINKYLNGEILLDALNDQLDDLSNNGYLIETQKNNVSTGLIMYRPWVFADELREIIRKNLPQGEKLPNEINKQAANLVPDLLRFPWSTLAITGDRQIFGMFVLSGRNQLKVKIIDALISHWDEMSVIGNRYYTGNYIYFNNQMVFDLHISLALSELSELLAQGGVNKELIRSGIPSLGQLIQMFNVREKLLKLNK